MKKRLPFSAGNTSPDARPTIAFLTPGIHLDSRYYEVWGGSSAAAQDMQVNLICFSVGRLTVKATALDNPHKVLLDFITSERIDGVISFEWWPNAERFEQICGRYRPLPLVNIMGDSYDCYSVTLDYEQLMRVKLQHLIEDHGYRRIMYLRGPQSWLGKNQSKVFLKVMAEYGLPLKPASVTSPYYDVFRHKDDHIECGRQGIRELLDIRRLKPGQDFEAILCFDDDVARGALQILQERDFRIPFDVAMMGSGGLEESRLTTPPLTTTAPPYYELGHKAIELMLSLLNGESVPQQTALPVNMRLRRSCGCSNPALIRSGAAIHREEKGSLELLSADRREQILTALRQAAHESWNRVHGWAAKLLDAFVDDMTGASPETQRRWVFIPTLENILYQVERAGFDVNIGHDVLSALRVQLLPYLSGNSTQRQYAEQLWQQARVQIHGNSLEAQQRLQAQKDTQAKVLREIGRQLISTFEMSGLMRILAEGLPRLGISGCYLSVYENPEIPTDGARLMLVYHEDQPHDPKSGIKIFPEGIPFPGSLLIPDDVMPAKRSLNLIAVSLHFGEEQIGYILFEARAQDDRNIYEILRAEISSALQGALLLGRATRQKYILDAFMENIPDNIYFKDRDSRLTHVNSAYLKCRGLSKLEEGIGKTDFDFFPAPLARLKYEQEQDIIQSGKPILALEETDFETDWVLTTKMPLRDEHGKIIGTFGISRNITELKQTQQSLEHANAEIRALNERLEEENLRMSAELDIARRLQEMTLPRPEELQQFAGLELSSYMQPADEVGGDYYDILEKDGTIYIGIGDVTGHGLESGVLMLMTQAAIRSLIEQGATDQIASVNTLNRVIYKNVQRMDVAKSLSFALLSYQQGQVRVAGQHEVILVVRRNGQVERMNTTKLGLPLGLVADISKWVAETTVSLEIGDGIVLYTDGITEAENEGKERYGLERLCDVISQNWSGSADDVKQTVIEDVRRYIGEQTVYDDLTLVVVKRQAL